MSDESPYPLAKWDHPENPGGRKVWIEMYPGGDAMIEVGGMDSDDLYVGSGEVETLYEVLGELIDAGVKDE